jgi:hypothetical protein
MTDRLTLARAFEEAGIKSEAADKLASEIYDAIHDNVATKTDLELAIRDLKIWTGSLAAALFILLFGALHFWPPH